MYRALGLLYNNFEALGRWVVAIGASIFCAAIGATVLAKATSIKDRRNLGKALAELKKKENMEHKQAWVTLATNDDYAVGARVLAQSLKNVGTNRKLHCLITNEVSTSVRTDLEAVFNSVTVVDVMHSKDDKNLALIGRPDLGITFTKLHCWTLTQYEKCVFLDADTLVLQNSDELFGHPGFPISAAADIGWPDMFNSGVFVFSPSDDTYGKLLNYALAHGSYDGGDQGLLNDFFSNWRDLPAANRLSFIYNMTAGVFYSYAAAFKKFGAATKIVHFIGSRKPWHSGASSSHQGQHVDSWNNVYRSTQAEQEHHDSVPQVDQAVAALQVQGSQGPSSEERFRAWERGEPDYMGRDSFSNIAAQLEKSLRE